MKDIEELLIGKGSHCFLWGIKVDGNTTSMFNYIRALATEIASYKDCLMPKGLECGPHLDKEKVSKFRNSLKKVPSLQYLVAVSSKIEYEQLFVLPPNHKRMFSPICLVDEFSKQTKDLSEGKLKLENENGHMTLSAALAYLTVSLNLNDTLLMAHVESCENGDWDNFPYKLKNMYQEYLDEVRARTFPLVYSFEAQTTPTNSFLKEVLVGTYEKITNYAYNLLLGTKPAENSLFKEAENFVSDLPAYPEDLEQSPSYKATLTLVEQLEVGLEKELELIKKAVITKYFDEELGGWYKFNETYKG